MNMQLAQKRITVKGNPVTLYGLGVLESLFLRMKTEIPVAKKNNHTIGAVYSMVSMKDPAKRTNPRLNRPCNRSARIGVPDFGFQAPNPLNIL